MVYKGVEMVNEGVEVVDKGLEVLENEVTVVENEVETECKQEVVVEVLGSVQELTRKEVQLVEKVEAADKEMEGKGVEVDD